MICRPIFEVRTINLLTALLTGSSSGEFRPKHLWKNEFWFNFIKIHVIEVIYPDAKHLTSTCLGEGSRWLTKETISKFLEE